MTYQIADQTLPLYIVHADRETGEWLSKELVGNVGAAHHAGLKDVADKIHYDTAEIDGQTVAVEVHWQ